MPEWVISPDELSKIIDEVVLLDVREQEEFDEVRIAGGVGGCKLIPLGELGARARQELSDVPADREIVVYCAHGMRSLQALMALKQLGFEHSIRSLDGGIAAWEEQSFPVQR